MKYLFILFLIISPISVLAALSKVKAKQMEFPARKPYEPNIYFCQKYTGPQGLVDDCSFNINFAEKYREANNDAGNVCGQQLEKAQAIAKEAQAKKFIGVEVYLFVEIVNLDEIIHKLPGEKVVPNCRITVAMKNKETKAIVDQAIGTYSDSSFIQTLNTVAKNAGAKFTGAKPAAGGGSEAPPTGR